MPNAGDWTIFHSQNQVMTKSAKGKQPGKSKNVATRDTHIVNGSNYIMTYWSS